MCIAIYKPANVVISKETLAQCFKANPDGAGFLISKNKKLIMKKGFFTFEDFYLSWEKYASEQALIHFRIKTHGDINVENCHPFMVNNGLGFIHNGVIVGLGEKDISDTNHFNREILQPLVDKFGNQVLFAPSVKHLIESRIGFSKLAFLDRHGNFNIFNESKGLWENGVWYSNYSFRIPLPFKATTYQQPKAPAPKYKTVEVGDLVTLIAGVYDQASSEYHKVGSILEVVAINKDYTVDLMSEHPNKDGDYLFVYNVSYAKFDFLELNLPEESDGFNYDNDVSPIALLKDYKH